MIYHTQNVARQYSRWVRVMGGGGNGNSGYIVVNSSADSARDPSPPIRTPCQSPKMMEKLLPLISSLRVQHGLITSSRKMFARCVKRRGQSVWRRRKPTKHFQSIGMLWISLLLATLLTRSPRSHPIHFQPSEFVVVSPTSVKFQREIYRKTISLACGRQTQSKRTEAPFSHLSNFAHVKMREEEMKGSLTRPL